MTNYEFYFGKDPKPEAVELIKDALARNIGVKDGKPVSCSYINCGDCEMTGQCIERVKEWFNQEHVETPTFKYGELVYITGLLNKDMEGLYVYGHCIENPFKVYCFYKNPKDALHSPTLAPDVSLIAKDIKVKETCSISFGIPARYTYNYTVISVRR